MSGDPEQEYFADGMVEDITTGLSRIKWLFVIARNSTFTYKGRTTDVKQVGRELGVRYVLEGSVRKATDRVRITGQLIDTATGAHIWGARSRHCAVGLPSISGRLGRHPKPFTQPDSRRPAHRVAKRQSRLAGKAQVAAHRAWIKLNLCPASFD